MVGGPSGLVPLPDPAASRRLVPHGGIRRVISRDKIQRRWVELSLLALRLGGLVALVFLVLPPGKAVAFLAVQLAVFGLYMGASFASNHIGMPFVSPKLKLDFLRRQVLMSRKHQPRTHSSRCS
ncbi:MAG TPA: hypothetical protein VFY56_17320 [Propionibacteriaceae bacterium]|nr:hypothetical protein [Propionibacteriaceae bacterium]